MFAKQPSCGGFRLSHSSGWEGMKGGGPGTQTHPAGQGYKRAGLSAERGAPWREENSRLTPCVSVCLDRESLEPRDCTMSCTPGAPGEMECGQKGWPARGESVKRARGSG